MKHITTFIASIGFLLIACNGDDLGNDGSSGPETTNSESYGDGDGDGDGEGDGDGDTGGEDLVPVDVGTAGAYTLLAKAGISTTGVSMVIGDMALSPADATYITGFELSSPPSTYSTSDMVTGQVWAADYDAPTPANLTLAVLDMEAAYADAAGRTLPDYTELGAGNIDGMTLEPGLYKWGTGVLIPTGVTLSGSATDVWIFQIGEDLTLGNGAMISLTGGAAAGNVFWQVAGQATLGTTSSFEGILLSQTLIEFNTGATMTGRAFAQSAVTLDATVITSP